MTSRRDDSGLDALLFDVLSGEPHVERLVGEPGPQAGPTLLAGSGDPPGGVEFLEAAPEPSEVRDFVALAKQGAKLFLHRLQEDGELDD